MANIKVSLRMRGSSFALGDVLMPITEWLHVQNRPTTFTPTPHTHVAKDITDANPPYFVIGNTTGTAGYWTGSISGLTAYYEGLRIDYRIGLAGAGTTYLNINGLGNVTCYRYSNSKLTTHFGVNYIIPLVYTTLNGGCFMIVGDTYDSTEDYNLRWQNSLIAGANINGNKIVMQGSDGKFYPLTIEAGTGTTKTVATYDFLLGGTILYYNTSTVLSANVAGGGYSFYESIYSGNLHYTANKSSGWTAYKPLYLKGTIQSNGAFRLDNSSYTSWLVQDLPTSDDGYVYILLGYMNDTGATWRLIVDHPIYHYKDGGVRLYDYVAVHNHDDRYYTEAESNARMFKHSARDFADGTIITTSIDYAVSSGDPFLLMIRGNSYGELIPFDIMIQGYIYSDTIINHGGKSSGKGLPTVYALNVGGYLTFWFARQAYWQGFDVYCIIANTENRENLVTSITNGVKPTGTKEVNLSTNIKQSIFEGDSRLTDARVASDVYSWAKQASKPSYNANEIGGLGANYRWLTDAYISTWNAKQDALGFTPYNATNPAGYISSVPNDHVTNARLANMAVNTIKARVTAGTGDPEDITPAQLRTMITDASNRFITDAERTAWNAKLSSIANDYISNAMLANMAVNTLKGRVTAGTGDPEDLTPAQVKTMLALVIGDVSGLQTALDGKIATSHYANNLSASSIPLGAGLADGFSYDSIAKELSIKRGTGTYVVVDSGNLAGLASGAGLATLNDLDSYVPQSMTINGYALNGNISLSNHDILPNTPTSKTSSFTLALVDKEDLIYVNSSSATTVTIPTNASVAFPIGTEVHILQFGSGGVSITPASGVTLYSDSNKRTINARYQAVTLKKLSTDTWVLFGALKV